MEKMPSTVFTVSDFIAITNQTLEYAYPSVEIEGEVASFKLNQGKYIFFDLKDAGGSIGCFMMAWQLRVPIEDGMRVVIVATPKLTQWGKFSLTVRVIRPSGEGSLKKSFELLRAKLDGEGLFAPERKRLLPRIPENVAVISSIDSAGYADFIKIINDRWGGLHVSVAHVQVQGVDAPDQIIRALRYFNAQETMPEVIVIIRGGGSADDLSTFSDELLVREIAASRVPTLVGVGHEIDVSLSDLAADVRAATPSNAAQLLVPDKQAVIRGMHQQIQGVIPLIERMIEHREYSLRSSLASVADTIGRHIASSEERLKGLQSILAQLDPNTVLARGYALVRGTVLKGNIIEIEKSDILIKAEVQHVSKK